MAASEGKLSTLHDKVAEVLLEAMDGQVIPGDENTPDIKLAPSAAILQVAAKFLKDNNITSAPSDDNALGQLRNKVEERRKARELRTSDLTIAKEDMSFMKGLPLDS